MRSITRAHIPLDEKIRRLDRRDELLGPATNGVEGLKECRRLRDAAGMTLADVAEVLGVSKASVAGWETGRCRPSPGLAVRYVELLEKIEAAESLLVAS